MAFKRALWHSGLTYEQTCEHCQAVVRYMDDRLDFRPWYPDGFVYCPRCQTPLRHHEEYAINAPQTSPVVDLAQTPPPAPTPAPAPTAAPLARFCSKCGNPFQENDRFCCRCGAKRGQ